MLYKIKLEWNIKNVSRWVVNESDGSPEPFLHKEHEFLLAFVFQLDFLE